MFCIHCGKQINDGSSFCTVCGKSQQSQAQQPQHQQESPPPAAAYVPQPVVAASPRASGYQGLLAANGLTQNVKHFNGLYTQIAVSDNGLIGIYYPPVQAVKGIPEQTERLELLHISQINDFDIDIEGVEKTKVSGGFGGALVGGLLGGTVGAVIGSAATSGNVKTNSKITGVTLIINTKDFNVPRLEVMLYTRFEIPNMNKNFASTPITQIPPLLRPHYKKNLVGYKYDGKGRKLIKEVFNNGEPDVAQIEALQSTLTQLLAAQQSSVKSAAPQQIDAADEMTKFKGLLDDGVISQEEFDAKKKQLLGI